MTYYTNFNLDAIHQFLLSQNWTLKKEDDKGFYYSPPNVRGFRHLVYTREEHSNHIFVPSPKNELAIHFCLEDFVYFYPYIPAFAFFHKFAIENQVRTISEYFSQTGEFHSWHSEKYLKFLSQVFSLEKAKELFVDLHKLEIFVSKDDYFVLGNRFPLPNTLNNFVSDLRRVGINLYFNKELIFMKPHGSVFA